jgi:hypothetical protein
MRAFGIAFRGLAVIVAVPFILLLALAALVTSPFVLMLAVVVADNPYKPIEEDEEPLLS